MARKERPASKFLGLIGFIGLIGRRGFRGFRGLRGFIGFIGLIGLRVYRGLGFGGLGFFFLTGPFSACCWNVTKD